MAEAVRILDIVICATYSLLCLGLLLAMDPSVFRVGTSRLSSSSRVDMLMYEYVSAVGLTFLDSAPPYAICGSAAAATNASFRLSISMEGMQCGGASEGTRPLATGVLDLSLPDRNLVIHGWLLRE